VANCGVEAADAGAEEGADVAGATDSPLLPHGAEPAQPTRRAHAAVIASGVVALSLIMLMDSSPLMEKSPSLGLCGG